MDLNPKKYNFMCLVDVVFIYKKSQPSNASINEMLGVVIDKKVKFDNLWLVLSSTLWQERRIALDFLDNLTDKFIKRTYAWLQE